jgi:mannose/fructose/N-acetylgalactosamine-specific phosphotransferase system component IID
VDEKCCNIGAKKGGFAGFAKGVGRGVVGVVVKPVVGVVDAASDLGKLFTILLLLFVVDVVVVCLFVYCCCCCYYC